MTNEQQPADQGRGVGEDDAELIEELLTQAQAHFNVDCCNDSYPIASTNRLLETAAKRIGELAAIAALTQPKGFIFSDEVCKRAIEARNQYLETHAPLGIPAMRAALTAARAALSLPRQSEAIKCYVATSKESCDAGPKYWVTIERGGKTITPYHTFIRGRAEYEVAEWNHLLNGAPEPDILAYDTDAPTTPQPAQADTTPAAHGVGFDSTTVEATGVVSKNGTDTGDKT